VTTTYTDLATLLSAGLDLCVRARKMDAQDRTNAMVDAIPGIDLDRAAPRLNANQPWAPYKTRSLTIPLWVQEQYERDLAEWEAKSRAALMQIAPPPHPYPIPREGEDPCS
jgi:hypothetical protein